MARRWATAPLPSTLPARRKIVLRVAAVAGAATVARVVNTAAAAVVVAVVVTAAAVAAADGANAIDRTEHFHGTSPLMGGVLFYFDGRFMDFAL